MQQKIISIIVGILIIFAGGLFYFSGEDNTKPEVISESVDLVALVNGEEITKEAFDIAKTQFITAQKIEVASLDEETVIQLNTQVLDSLISNSLIQQAIKENKIKVSDKDIDDQIELIKSQFEDEDGFQKILLEQNLSEEDLRSQVSSDLITQVYLEKELDLESITVTEEEVEAVYNQEASVNSELPALSEIGGQIEAFIVQQKQQELLALHIQKLIENAEIEILN